MSDTPPSRHATPSATPHAQPFLCPYCGEQELRPDGEPESWFCPSCARAFSLKLLAVRR
jgi:hypothetical protein